MQDKDIVDLYWARNENAIKVTEHHYGTYCMTVSMGILNSRPDAEECVNDTWLSAWNSMPPQKPSCLRAFLGKITRNLSIDRFRFLHSSKRNVDLTVAMEELGEAIPMPDDTRDEELCGLLNSFLEGLETLDRKLFVGRYWYGTPVSVLAERYGMKPNTVSQRLGRIRTALKQFLENRGYHV